MAALITDKNKYTKKLHGFFVNGFLNKFFYLFNKTDGNTLLDAGCGEGAILNYLNQRTKIPKECHGIDFNPQEIEMAKSNISFCHLQVASIYNLPFPDKSFDIVICTEVLEHLHHPEEALCELKRISAKYVILSVPREPLWRILNMVRFKYLSQFGNTPDHKNHWSKKHFQKFVKSKFDIIETSSPIPWTLVLCQVKNN
ncbi:MAG: hypothetical protein CV087_16930 [Candidatus Brocadia sp. WS118]|nr:MAG: hypothetical protein CV087_16930 [Candidatus Brocadia sp. WS118]